jgi:hypothetical protein
MREDKIWKNMMNAVTTQDKRIIGFKKGASAKKQWITQEIKEKKKLRVGNSNSNVMNIQKRNIGD